MMRPTMPFTNKELKWVEAMVARNMGDLVSPISPELSREICYFKLTVDACNRFIAASQEWLEKHGKAVG